MQLTFPTSFIWHHLLCDHLNLECCQSEINFTRTPAPSNQIGIIVGGAVGGSVFLLLVVGLLVYFLVIRKNLAYKDYVEELTSSFSSLFIMFSNKLYTSHFVSFPSCVRSYNLLYIETICQLYLNFPHILFKVQHLIPSNLSINSNRSLLLMPHGPRRRHILRSLYPLTPGYVHSHD